jgi:hypothetical protein
MTTDTRPGETAPAGYTLPAWKAADLPPTIATLVTETGLNLEVRYARAGDRLGSTRTLPPGADPVLEVRRRDRLCDALGTGGHVLAVWDLDLFLSCPSAQWQVLEEGMTYACPPSQLRHLYDVVTRLIAPAVD